MEEAYEKNMEQLKTNQQPTHKPMLEEKMQLLKDTLKLDLDKIESDGEYNIIKLHVCPKEDTYRNSIFN